MTPTSSDNASTITIEELTDDEAFRAAYPLIAQLRHNLTEADYARHLSEMRSFGYRLFGLYADGELRSLAGGMILHNFYNGRYFFLCDLVTDASYRSLGYGERLLEYVERWAEAQGCVKLELTSGLEREAAHHFYEKKMGYLRTSYVFRRSF